MDADPVGPDGLSPVAGNGLGAGKGADGPDLEVDGVGKLGIGQRRQDQFALQGVGLRQLDGVGLHRRGVGLGDGVGLPVRHVPQAGAPVSQVKTHAHGRRESPQPRRAQQQGRGRAALGGPLADIHAEKTCVGGACKGHGKNGCDSGAINGEQLALAAQGAPGRGAR